MTIVTTGLRALSRAFRAWSVCSRVTCNLNSLILGNVVGAPSRNSSSPPSINSSDCCHNVLLLSRNTTLHVPQENSIKAHISLYLSDRARIYSVHHYCMFVLRLRIAYCVKLCACVYTAVVMHWLCPLRDHCPSLPPTIHCVWRGNPSPPPPLTTIQGFV